MAIARVQSTTKKTKTKKEMKKKTETTEKHNENRMGMSVCDRLIIEWVIKDFLNKVFRSTQTHTYRK